MQTSIAYTERGQHVLDDGDCEGVSAVLGVSSGEWTISSDSFLSTLRSLLAVLKDYIDMCLARITVHTLTVLAVRD